MDRDMMQGIPPFFQKAMISAKLETRESFTDAKPSPSLMPDSKIESSTEALASGVEKADGDGKAEYTIEKGNELTGDYQKEKVSYKK